MMKNCYPGKVFSLLILILFIACGGAYAQADLNKTGKGKRNFYEDRHEKLLRDGDIINNQKKTWKQFKRWEYFWEKRVYPTGDYPNAYTTMKEYNSFKAAQKKTPSTLSNKWTLIGPEKRPLGDDGATGGVGRVNVVRFNPSNSNELWIGAASGGVWRSKDFGSHWELFPFTQFLSLGISDIMFSQSDPNTVYVATGDADGTVGSGNDFYTIGIIKTTDGGATWNVTGFSKLLSNQVTVGRLWVHPQDPNIVIAATSMGIYKTTDGGVNWTSKLPGYFTIDMEQAPGNTNCLYASTFSWSGNNYVLRSMDMGETWKEVKKFQGSIRVAIEVTPAAPDNVYTLVSKNQGYGFHSVAISDDRGENWSDVLESSTSRNYLGWYDGLGDDNGGQGTYDLALAVSPKDPSLLYIGGVNVWRLESYGAAEMMVGNYQADGAPGIHADQHDLRFTPDGKKVVSTNDGGVDFTEISKAGWTSIKDGLSITQNYRIASSDEHPEVILNGTQDNGSMGFFNGEWRHVLGGDGMDCGYSGKDPEVIFSSTYYGSIYKSYNSGKSYARSIDRYYTHETGGWVTPFLIHPQYPNVTYAGFLNVWRSYDTGEFGTWTKISDFGEQMPLVAIAAAPSDERIIYAANSSKVWATYNSGVSWEIIYNSTAAITSLTVHPTKPKTLWITQSGFNPKNKVFEWNGDTKKLKNISGNLPNIPVNCLIYQKNSPDRLYIGTDVGVFFSDFNSAHWEQFGENLPPVIVEDLDISYNASPKLRAGTYGRGIWEAPLLSCTGMQPIVKAKSATEFCAGDSVELEALIDPSQLHYGFSWSDGYKEKKRVVKESGDYSVQLTDPNSDCVIRSGAVFVNVFQPQPLKITSATGKFAICGEDGDLDIWIGLGGGYHDFKWSTGDTTRRITITQPGDYHVTAVSADGCTVTSETITAWRKTDFTAGDIYQKKDTLFAPSGTKFQWYYLDKEIGFATKSFYCVPDSAKGLYKVRYNDEDGCQVFSNVYNFVSGISEAITGDNGVLIIPNPAYDKIRVDFKMEGGSSAFVRIYNSLGANVLERTVFGAAEFDVSKLAAGSYFVEISIGDKRFVNTFVKR